MSYLSNYDIIITKDSDNLYIEVINKNTNKQYHKIIFTDDLTNQYIKSLDELYQLFQVGTNKIKPKNPNNYIIIEFFENEDNQNLKLIVKYDIIFEIEIMLDKVKLEDEKYKNNTEIVELKKTVAELKKNLNHMSEIMSEMYIDSPQYKNYILKSINSVEQISYILDKFEISLCINIMYITNINIILFIHNKYEGKIQIKVFTDGEFENEPKLRNLDNLVII